ncbi:MAG: dihydroneopterin aldolase [Massilibacteroides sp.]|nr:dihydroneopterin aldolase [Massilibacteroides sp.]MDD3062455.1 dihydroneopterin aldolase [Massilibacteroides sp.]MDD4114828.1 dihydroneopterin aldolase [Massilibacteroides sp.]MDD4659858.1 dihydroneopterin aldolase [Massilibacteroides sp.]
METCIELKNIRLKAYHGVFEQERKLGNLYSLDVFLGAPLEKAVLSDDLNDTVNYADVYAIVKAEMDIPSDLLEHVAGRILVALKKNFPQLTSIELKISKLNPPIKGEIGSASVILRQTYS